MSAPGARGGRRAVGQVVPVLAAAVVAAVGTLALAPLGSAVLYGLAGLAVLVATGWALRRDLAPVLVQARTRARHLTGRRVGARAAGPGTLLLAAAVAAVVPVVGGGHGLLLLGVIGGVLVVAVAGWLCWPLLGDLLAPAVGGRARGPALRIHRGLLVPVAAVVAVALALVLGSLGPKVLLAVVGVLVVGALVARAADRETLVLFLAVVSLAVLLHKSVGPQDLQLSGGAISVYVTTFDVLVLLLFVLWWRTGTLGRELRAAIGQWWCWFPLVGVVTVLPSLAVAVSAGHVASELVRMAWMYALYVYVAVRVRSRRQVWAVLGGLAVFAVLEFVVVLGQWATGGTLGLSFLGIPTTLTERTTDQTTLGRPFGTIIHPVFLGAVMGSLTLLALALVVVLRRSLARVAAGAAVVVCALPLYLAHTRASVLAVVIAAVYLVWLGVARGHLRWAVLGRVALAGLLVGLALLPQLSAKFSENFFTGHFWEEIDSRVQLNSLAMDMIADHWFLGVGYNNFELVLPQYERGYVIFANNPVHNLYLLWFAETGVVGMLGLLVVAGGLLRAAVRTARSRDPLVGAVGAGTVAVLVFLGLEELLGFSLRQDVPLALFWLLAGLCVACMQMTPERLAAGRRHRVSSTRRPAGRGRTGQPGSAGRARGRRGVRGRGSVRALPAALVLCLAGLLPSPGSTLAADAATTTTAPAATASDLATGGPSSGTAASGTTSPDAAASGTSAPAGTGSAPQTDPGTPSAGSTSSDASGTGSSATALASLAPPGSTTAPTVTDGPQAAPDATSGTATTGAGLPADGDLVIEAVVRATGRAALFTTAADGTGLQRISPDDGRDYEWPRWAFGGTRVVYTVREGGQQQEPTDIVLAMPDGSAPQVVASFDYRVAQPVVDPSGRWLYFTALTPWFPDNALFKMDLTTLLSTNLTAVGEPLLGLDADPVVTADGSTVLVVQGAQDSASIVAMDTDGTHRRALTNDGYWATDPDVSPDGGSMAIASYRGPDTPSLGGYAARPRDFFVVVSDADGGDERVLTGGQDCTTRTPDDPCTVAEMSGYAPQFTTGASRVGFVGALDSRTVCICATGVDGSDPQVLVSSTDLALNWFDVRRTGGGGDPGLVGSARDTSRVLVTARDARTGGSTLYEASADLMHRTPVDLPAGLQPVQARWSPDGTQVVFTASVAVPGRAGAPHPAAPAGSVRREHVTLADLDPVQAASGADAAVDPTQQVFLRSADGSVRQLTDPWIEDWQDGVRRGDVRANTDPVFTPDGRSVLVTNTSSLTGESFVLRIDLADGAVLNLTNATSGAVPVADRSAAVSPDGRSVAFCWVDGGVAGVFTMRTDGFGVTPVGVGGAPSDQPAWTPDGSALLSVRDDAGTSALVRTDLGDGAQQVLTRSSLGLLRPAVGPDGVPRFITLLAGMWSLASPAASGAPTAVQPDRLHHVLDQDWR